MKSIIKKGLILLALYVVFTTYLFVASERIEYLEREDDSEMINVSIIYGE